MSLRTNKFQRAEGEQINKTEILMNFVAFREYNSRQMRQSGIEPERPPWEGEIIPLDHWRLL